ncbi:ketopantoate reductase family protein [Nitrosophilus labii]|uniref:ketopantoate reductase family protein n=1 Tax=Nitrosophilus labii TaxID=2706014 RepID=UPI001656B955|nr:2-dehydropantoate 2-reductase [Nitrosophilus labii]
MKIAIVGVGGVGGYIGAKLSKVTKVDLITQNPQNLKDGIVLIEDGKKSFYKNFSTYQTPPKDIVYDCVIFAVKSYVLKEAVKNIENNVSKHTIILPLLNGIEPYEILKNSFKDSNVAKGAIYIISNKTGKNEITLKGKGAYIVFGKDYEVNSLLWLKDLFEKSDIKTKLTKQIDKEIWKKYLFIAATSALTSYYKATFGEIGKNHLKEYETLLDEIIQIANEKGVSLEQDDKKRAIELLLKSPPNSKTSMQLDFENKTKTEIDNILGYLVKLHINEKNSKIKKIYTELKPQNQI